MFLLKYACYVHSQNNIIMFYRQKDYKKVYETNELNDV